MKKELLPQFFKALKHAGIDSADRADYIQEWTDGRTSSAREMTDIEAVKVIRHINVEYRKATKADLRDQLRKRLIGMAYGIGFDTEWCKQWCEKNGVGAGEKRVCKKFNQYTVSELYALRAKMEKVVADHIAAVDKRMKGAEQ